MSDRIVRRGYYRVAVRALLALLPVMALVVGVTGCPAPTAGVQIRNWHDLDAIRDNLGGDILLMNNLDSTSPGYQELAGPAANGGQGWQPIGVWPNPFTGRFDGQGFQIRDLYIDRPVQDHVGLFSFAVTGAVIINVAVIDVDVTGREYVGALVGHIHGGSLSSCHSTGSVTGHTHVGGLAGESGAAISNAHSTAIVTGVFEVGGLIGLNHGTIDRSYSGGTVTGVDYVGGLVGWNQVGAISDSYSTATVEGISLVGGLVGSNRATVSNSFSTGTVTGLENVGGLAGRNFQGTVSNSFWDIESSGRSTSEGGTGKGTAEMQDIATYSTVTWNILAVADPEVRDTDHIWNIVDGLTYPFLSWEPAD